MVKHHQMRLFDFLKSKPETVDLLCKNCGKTAEELK